MESIHWDHLNGLILVLLPDTVQRDTRLFMAKTPRNYADVLASDQAAMRRLDTLLMKQGQYVLPGVRRFVSTVHTPEDLEHTLHGLDTACREFNRS